MEKFIHGENLALFRKRLAEPHGEAERQVLLKLLAEEEAKDLPRATNCEKSAIRHRGARDQF